MASTRCNQKKNLYSCGFGVAVLVGLFGACQDIESVKVIPDSSEGGPAASGSNHAGASGAAGTSNVDFPDASQAEDAMSDAPADVELPDLTHGLPGPRMVRVRTPDGDSYYIDSTEVTQSQYQAFLTDISTVDFQPELPAFCKENESYSPPLRPEGEPAGGVKYCPDNVFLPDTTPNLPMVCVDWCDAQAYCKWAGKRLCGRVGGGANDVSAALSDANKDEWYNACSNGGKTKYPYGDMFDRNRCNTSESKTGFDADGKSVLANAGSKMGCNGTTPPFNQIFDMSANVEEWEDACLPSPDIATVFSCGTRGSYYYYSPENNVQVEGCDVAALFTALIASSPVVGFRCCHDGP